MGAANSTQQDDRPIYRWGAAILRRLQIWRNAKPLVSGFMTSLGYGVSKTSETPPIVEETSSHESPADQEDAVNLARALIEEALPIDGEVVLDVSGRLSLSSHEVNQEEAGNVEDNGSVGGSKSTDEWDIEEVPEHDLRLVQDVQSLIQRVAPDLIQPDKLQPAEDTPKEVQEEYVADYIRSSLNIALPTYRSLTSGPLQNTTLSTNTTFPTLSIEDKDSVQTVASQTNALVETEPMPPPLPPAVEKELQEMLTNYETWDKKLYSDLNLDVDSIRLVEILPGSSDEIQVELVKQSLDEIRNAYEALSYVWGPPEPAKTIQVNGVSVKINPNLFDALTALRLPDVKRTVWIDAICINQTKTRERSTEVQKMGEIYRSARTVVIYLGAPQASMPSSSIRELFKFLNRSDDGDSHREGGSIAVDALFHSSAVDKYAVCKGFIELCLRPWWGRVWTMQEFYLASDEPVWYWGREHVGNGALKRDMSLLRAISWDLFWRDDVRSGFRSHMEDMIQMPMNLFMADVRRIFDFVSRRAATHGYDIPSRLYRELLAKSTDPRDIVYGLREIFDPVFRKVFVPDYFMSQDLLFACLVVFLIQFEGWADVLWWYPFRRAENNPQIPSWLPDFTRRVVPADSDFIPRDHLASKMIKPKLAIVHHALHAEGYKLDKIKSHGHLNRCSTLAVQNSLWRFEQIAFNRLTCLDYVKTEEDRDEPLLDIFLQLCRKNSDREDHHITHDEGSVLQWASSLRPDRYSWPEVIDSLPFLDLLTYQAFKPPEETPTTESSQESNTRTGILRGIFSPRIDSMFFKTLSMDFIGASVFDWENLTSVLDRLISKSPWSAADSAHWQSLPDLSSTSQIDSAEARIKDVRTFLTDLGPAQRFQTSRGWGCLHHYVGLCIAILLDCDSHPAFTRVVSELKAAGTKLNEIAESDQTPAEVARYAAVDRVVANRIDLYNEVASQFSGRCVFVTERGFRGVTSPGVEFCGNASVVLLDGMSFPVVVLDLDDKSGCGQFVGCAIISGVSMQGSEDGGVRVPKGFSLGEKTIFKFK